MTIDESLAELERVAARLEQEDLPLEEALELFEAGLTLAAGVKSQLDAAKLRVDQVIEKTKDAFSLEPFDLS